uniref:Phosphoglycerate kinase n=1 Tax=Pinguiococcus pyrenoidosus TaxID=172671 RepID=A0A7R9UE60_9STRA|mmetsp:Transcript_4787/g.19185  ORF Transcript_4787/g.19185 Transcript_4787/m.19185 type:complete len:426 (+) Transcript_4787:103-1380(+)
MRIARVVPSWLRVQPRATRGFAIAGKKTLEDLTGIASKTVLVRGDLNVPLDKSDGKTITDDTRIRAIAPTVQHLLQQNAKVVLVSHFGRPKGKVVDSMRMDPVVDRLSEVIGAPVTKLDDCIGPDVESAVSGMQDGDVVLLENVRFHKEEEKNEPEFAKQLAKLADVYVNDAFGTAHRAHASTAGVTEHMSQCVAGKLMEKELKFLIGALASPKRPMVAIVGGAKVSTKLPVLKSLLDKCDRIIIGGGMVFTFYRAQGLSVGKSRLEEDLIPAAAELMEEAKARGVDLIIPRTCLVADAVAEGAAEDEVDSSAIPDTWAGVDVGHASIEEEIKPAVADANTIVWNGPMGVFEIPAFAKGAFAVAHMLAERTNAGATTIIGGGDSVAAVEKAGLAEQMSHISTGGGASLELLEGKVLPGVAALDDA